jgi:hypothetical protein
VGFNYDTALREVTVNIITTAGTSNPTNCKHNDEKDK